MSYLELAEPKLLTEHNWAEGTEPLVTINCITYNHNEYIESAIKGFLAQKTRFPVQILIHDDASKDGTAEIVKHYQNTYPRLIEAILQTENQHSLGVNPGAFTTPLIKGKYIATCEGDDYWIDEFKLQKQISFLEENPDFSLCHSECDLDNRVHGKYIKNHGADRGWRFDVTDDLPAKILNRDYEIITCTTCYPTRLRNFIKKEFSDDFGPKFKMRDTQLFFHLSRLGKVKYFSESMGVYRKVPGSATALDDKHKHYKFIENAYSMKCELAEKYNFSDLIPKIHSKHIPILVNLAKTNLDREGILKYTKVASTHSIDLGLNNRAWSIMCKSNLLFCVCVFLARIKKTIMH